jgi:predicted unusual protein kinase regulating ubiquinone biosynthesis (AarF/ABC1/UbiB family)
MNLVLLLSSIVQYNLPIMNSSHNKRKCVATIKQLFIEGGGVWQKFAQVLSGHEGIIGIELANELQSMMFDCPSHCDKYSARIIKDAFGDNYETSHMKMIGSGTISQVHKAKINGTNDYVAIKVMHPNIKKEIKEACDTYDSIKDSFMFPTHLKTITRMFFDGLKEQLDMEREFKNGKAFAEIYNGNFVIVPKMIDFSKKCLVMSYEESELACSFKATESNKHMLLKLCNAITIIQMNMIYTNWLHLDLHMGNYGVRNYKNLDNMQIVIYDFGHCRNIHNFSSDRKFKLLRGFVTRNYKVWAAGIAPKYYDEIIKLCYNKKNSYEENTKHTLIYLLTNENFIDGDTMDICTQCTKVIPSNNMIKTILSMKDMKKYNMLEMSEESRESYSDIYRRELGHRFMYPEFDELYKYIRDMN